MGLSELTGDEVWDGVASVLIGLLLLLVATVLAYNNITLLVGRAVPERLRREIERELSALPAVRRIRTLLTMHLGPTDILIAAKIDFDDEVSGATIEATADEAERRLTRRYPGIRYVFLHPTAAGEPAETGPDPRP